MNSEEFRDLGHRLIDWIADFRTNIADHPVRSKVEPGWVRRELDRPLPRGPEDPQRIFDDLDRVVLPGLSHFQHPGYFAFFPANASLASVLGDLVSTGLGAVGLNWEAAPALTEMEELVCDGLRRLLGLGPDWKGAIHDTASTANLVAALCGRERASGYGQERGGAAEGPPLTMYASEQAHSSVEKAMRLAGIGRRFIRLLPTDASFRLDTQALAKALERDANRGLAPALVVACVGTTGTASIDPVAEIVECARPHGAWVHVDAALAGGAMILEECRPLWQGVEGADSIAINAHKWIGTALDCSLLYVRDPGHLVRVMSTDPSYLKNHRADRVTQLRDWGIPLGRRFRALKLWFHLRLDGTAAIRARLRRDLANARWLREQIEAAPHWKLTAPPSLQTLCMRHEPEVGGATLAGDALDAHTLAWVEAINEGGGAYLTPTRLEGRWTGRVSIGAELTERRHVEALWQQMRRAVGDALPARPPGEAPVEGEQQAVPAPV